jgi:release factor glutamine methyltransferase
LSNIIIVRLLAEVLGKSTEFVYAHPEFELDNNQAKRLEGLVERAANHEPLAYLLGYKEFYGRNFKVTPDTLIPRPETEQIVEIAIAYVGSRSRAQGLNAPHLLNPRAQALNPILVDVGTGSGAIALTLAKELPNAQIYGLDISRSALKVARSNASLLDVLSTVFLLGSLLEPLEGVIRPNTVDVIVANLPYISDNEFDNLPPEVRNFEPELALKSGSDPDTLNRILVDQSKKWLKPGGLLVYETTNGQIVSLSAPA